MKRLLALALIGLASIAAAEGARIAVHPLDARELTVEQREWLKAFFDVRLARTTGVQLAGSNRVEDALRSPHGKDCETKDQCLRYLAQSSGSLYAVYARLRREPEGGELLMTARVVRADGAVVKSVSRRARPQQKVELVETCRTLVSSVVDGLELHRLPGELGQVEPAGFEDLPPPPLVSVDEPGQLVRMSPRRVAGLALCGVGATILASGGLLFGMAGEGRRSLNLDANGAVPPGQAERAANVALQGRAGTTLIPVGVIIGVGGALIAFWPENPPLKASLLVGPQSAGLLVGGRFP